MPKLRPRGKPLTPDDPRQHRAARWKPGQSGNPEGGSQALRLRALLKDRLAQARSRGETYGQAFIISLVDAGIAKDMNAARLIFGYTEGGIPQPITGDDGGPIDVRVRDMTDEQLRAIVDAASAAAKKR